MIGLQVGSVGAGGLSFAIPDLMIARGWAEFHDLDLRVELDCCIDGAELEEMLSFYLPGTAVRCWRIWQTGSTVILLSNERPPLQFASLADALDEIGALLVSPD